MIDNNIACLIQRLLARKAAGQIEERQHLIELAAIS